MIDFSNIAYLPIDVPKFQDNDEMLTNLEGLNHSIYGTSIDGNDIWHSFNLLEGYAFDKHKERRLWAESARKNVPKLIEFIENNIPLKGYRMVTVRRQMIEVDCHIDAVRNPETSLCGDPTGTSNLYLNYSEPYEPLGYKILINGTANNHFYLSKNEGRGCDIKEEDRHYIQVPEDTNCFVLPYAGSPHGSILEEKDRLILLMHGYVDPDWHKEVLTRSYNKYKDYVIWASDL